VIDTTISIITKDHGTMKSRHRITIMNSTSTPSSSDVHSPCSALRARIALVFTAFVVTTAMFSAAVRADGVSALSGRIMGSNGSPLAFAAVELFRYGSVNADTMVTAAATGGFSLDIPKHGVYKVRISGLHHEPVTFPYVCDVTRREEIRVTLAPTQLPRRIDSVCAVGSFNGYSVAAARRMESKNGAYRVKIGAMDHGASWQVLVYGDSATLRPVRVCSITADGYTVVEGRAASRIESRSTTTELVFDPSSVPQRNAPASVTAGNAKLESFIATAMDVMERQDRYNREMDAALVEHRRAGGDNANFDVAAFRNRMGIGSMEQRLKERIRLADDTLTERLLYLAYLALPEGDKDKVLMERALRVIPAWSSMWAIDPQAMYTALNARQRDSKEQYINDVLATNSEENVVVPIAYAECIQAQVAGVTSRQWELYKLLVKDHPKHPLSIAAKLYLNPDRMIQPGKTLPAFSMMPSGASTAVSSTTLKGMRTLIDIRTDHCGVCESGFAALVSGIKESETRPIRVLALSIGNEPATTKEERGKTVLVQSARVVPEEGQDAKVLLEYVGYPWRILLNEKLEVEAVGNDLDNEHWRVTLQRSAP
ncbi:MAG: carboxypeptidase-like regulatory domain-containing protein, partial [Candidatus Kapaibacterium sp.]